NPIATPPEDIIYTLEVTDHCGTIRDDIVIKVLKEIHVPNAFSPNGDLVNDTWEIVGLSSYPDADLSVFNRYGQLVFQSTGYPAAWDGRSRSGELAKGTYYYIIKLSDKKLSGSVHIF